MKVGKTKKLLLHINLSLVFLNNYKLHLTSQKETEIKPQAAAFI